MGNEVSSAASSDAEGGRSRRPMGEGEAETRDEELEDDSSGTEAEYDVHRGAEPINGGGNGFYPVGLGMNGVAVGGILPPAAQEMRESAALDAPPMPTSSETGEEVVDEGDIPLVLEEQEDGYGPVAGAGVGQQQEQDAEEAMARIVVNGEPVANGYPGETRESAAERDSAQKSYRYPKDAAIISVDSGNRTNEVLKALHLTEGTVASFRSAPDASMAPQHQGNLIVRHRKPKYDPALPVPGLIPEMFRNLNVGVEHDKIRSEGHSLKRWIDLPGGQDKYMSKNEWPPAIFVDALQSTFQKRVTGRYFVCSKLYNGAPFWYSRMARMYIYNHLPLEQKGDEPEWVIGKRVGSCAHAVLLAGDLRALRGMGEKPKKGENIPVYSYSKKADKSYKQGELHEGALVGESKWQRRSHLKVELNTLKDAGLMRRTTQRLHHSGLSPNAFVQDKAIHVLQACKTTAELTALQKKSEKEKDAEAKRRAGEDVLLQYDAMKKEWYLARHSPIQIFKKLGQPTSVVGLYLPLIEEYGPIFPKACHEVFKRVKDHAKNKNAEESYLEYPKYYCCENELFMFFNPKKGQWKVINTAIMHKPHPVKACSDPDSIGVAFPPLAVWQQNFEPMVQFPAVDGTLIDNQLKKQHVYPFIDKEFPPARSSLGEKGPNTVPGDVEWYRARDIHDTDFPVKLFDNVEPNDCIQGGLGDCWLLAALAVVAEYPDFIPTYTFHEKECNLIGRYSVNLFDYSKKPPSWRVITVDDYIPCYPKSPFSETPIPRFSQPNCNEMWLLLLEKAFAKLAGGYLNLKAGYAGLAWIALTGCMDYGRWIKEKDENKHPPPAGGPQNVDKATADTVKHVQYRRRPIASFHPTGNRLGFEYCAQKKTDEIVEGMGMIDYLRKAEKNFYPICAVGVHGTAAENKRSDGLVDGHAYSVLQVLDINCVDGKKRTLVKLRNPWGDNHEWTGPFSDDHDASWKLVKDNGKGIRVQEADGIFWMEAAAFLAYFTHVECLHFNMKDKKSDVAAVDSHGLSADQKKKREDAKKARDADKATLSMKFYKPHKK
ncbi:unnamed protein product [Amoebophrya sp. A25]|nr:unnamed protein product [Amoebophrya sp. A25]|eukprot:GSA25T00026404001.1